MFTVLYVTREIQDIMLQPYVYIYFPLLMGVSPIRIPNAYTFLCRSVPHSKTTTQAPADEPFLNQSTKQSKPSTVGVSPTRSPYSASEIFST